LVSRIELVRSSEFADAESAQFVADRYEPETLTVPEPIDIQPENTAVIEPVGAAHGRAEEGPGSAANVAPGVVGCWHTVTLALSSDTLLERLSELTEPLTAQLVAPKYEPETLTVPEPIETVPANTAVTAPVATGHGSEPPEGGDARVAPGVVGLGNVARACRGVHRDGGVTARPAAPLAIHDG
jgi:hypothetical protein